MIRPGVTTMWTAQRTRWSIRWRCAPLGWSTAVSSRPSAAATSRARPWSRSWCREAGSRRGVGSHRHLLLRSSNASKKGGGAGSGLLPTHASAAAGGGAWCVLCFATISSQCRRRLAGSEQRVACRPDHARVDGALFSTRASRSCQHSLKMPYTRPTVCQGRKPFKRDTAYLATWATVGMDGVLLRYPEFNALFDDFRCAPPY